MANPIEKSAESDPSKVPQLPAATKELESLSYAISHDLRAPLRSINAFSQLLREEYYDKLDEQGQEYVRILTESSALLSRMIDGLLQLSRIGRGELHRETVDLAALAAQIVARLRNAAPQREVEVAIASELKASGDERLLRMALEHLLANAWKFTSKKERAKIEVGSEQQAEGPVFFVRDDGAGFDPEYAGKLFGAFQRLHSGGEFPGLGIGLALVQRVISRHGGRVWAEAAMDKGATFYFTLPN
jgi:light-regulated signal transduction histidine kinase (bacteriophytochrome)